MDYFCFHGSANGDRLLPFAQFLGGLSETYIKTIAASLCFLGFATHLLKWDDEEWENVKSYQPEPELLYILSPFLDCTSLKT